MANDVLRVVVTLGPTDEKIDDVMKITNMSTGALGALIAGTLNRRSKKVNKSLELWLVCNKTTYLINRAVIDELVSEGARLVTIGGFKQGQWVLSETEDMLFELEKIFAENKIDCIFHSAAVGDYTGRFATSATLLAQELQSAMQKAQAEGRVLSADEMKAIIAEPKNVFNQDTKMSSDEPGMIVGLGLTTKVISRINGFAEKSGYATRLVSWKLLSGVEEQELYDIALAHGRRNNSFMVVANDLDKISADGHWAMLINIENASRIYAHNKQEIADKLAEQLGL